MALIKVSNLEEVTFSTGTGDLVLSGPGRGGKGLYTRCVPGDTFRYYIHGVGSNGLPEGEWETGLGTYKANNTVERTTVENSSNNDSRVNFSAGTKYLRIEGSVADGIRESQSVVQGDSIAVASADLATAIGTAGSTYRISDGPDAGAPLVWAIPSGASTPTWCWWAWPQAAYEG
jgi:hypothetical protein